MKFEFLDNNEPAYKQLSDQITRAIVNGELKPGDKLPSEAALYETTGLSKGTIRMAYEELENKGCVKRNRGSGTYVLDWGTERQKIQEYKEKALLAGISAEKAFHLIEEACRLRFRKKEEVRAALFDCTPEIAADMCWNIRERYKFLPAYYNVYEVLEAFGEVVPEEPLWITTKAHYHELQNLAKANNKILVALKITVAGEVAEALSGLSDTRMIGIIYDSQDFIKHISHSLASLCKHNTYFLCHRDEWKKKRHVVAPEAVCWVVPAHCEEQLVKEIREDYPNVLEFYYTILPDSYKALEQYLQEE